MEVRDIELLQSLKRSRNASNRDLAKVVGYKSHSYMNRIMSGAAKSMEPEPALRLAKFFQIGVDFLFTTEVSTEPTRNERKSKPRRGKAP